ncbi:AAA family ATPase [Mycobacterium sp. AT1]|uniref:AAA family ATPase n=1 Tax=Mycobacterium sp. AT1 TaxID=1961706 RepID=UPI0009AD7BE5|nr:AAA family ATPase [Mycobacterium sp. AT1]OPX10923.1 hypothetical protein B1790_09780 [Mycobacterium sp. AT1]
MYLRELFVRNSGPTAELHLTLAFDSEDRPISQVLVGKNGSGKTNVLSLIADALMECSADTYSDVLRQSGAGRSYFRIVGSKTVRYGQAGGFSILRFEHGDQEHFYREKAGSYLVADAQQFLPDSLKPAADWPDTADPYKSFSVEETIARGIYSAETFAHFPASRSEHPYWFNQNALVEDDFETRERYRQNLGKPLFVEHGVDAFAQWMLGVLTESRSQLLRLPLAAQTDQAQFVNLDGMNYDHFQQPLVNANALIKIITGDPTAEFYWTGRRNPRKVGIKSIGGPIVTGLDALSGGQSTLLAMFGTILRYGDDAAGRAGKQLEAKDIRGIVVIDELDAHMHVDLQMAVLPQLIALFPRIQFIISSHSPFFVLGLEKTFGPEGVRVASLPDGNQVAAEAYEDFGHALDALRETQAFSDEIAASIAAAESPLIWVGGETDLIYLRTAAQILGFEHLVEYFEWVGASGQTGGSNMNSGDPGLNLAYKLLKANPNLTGRKIVLVYDSDANKPDDTFGNVHIISLSKIPDAYCRKGVENLLPAAVFSEDMYQMVEKPGDYGKPTIVPELRKMDLCESLTGSNTKAENFENFRPTLVAIDNLLAESDQNAPSPSVDDAPPTDG